MGGPNSSGGLEAELRFIADMQVEEAKEAVAARKAETAKMVALQEEEDWVQEVARAKKHNRECAIKQKRAEKLARMSETARTEQLAREAAEARAAEEAKEAEWARAVDNMLDRRLR